MNPLFKKIHLLFFVIVLMALNACTSVPTTNYFTLVADNTLSTAPNLNEQTSKSVLNIGIGPISVSDSLDSFSVLSLEDGNQVLLDPFQLWAGNLKSNINQVLADNISTRLGTDSIWAFPWDNRNRPEVQVRVVFEKFIGELGRDVTLQAKWVVLSDYGKKAVITKKTVITEALNSDDYLSYVKGLNTALNKFSLLVADELSKM